MFTFTLKKFPVLYKSEIGNTSYEKKSRGKFYDHRD